MLTATFKKEGKSYVYADVFDNFSKLKKAYKDVKPKIPNLQTFLLTPVDSGEDLVITKLEGRWVACIGPKKELRGEKFVKVTRQEIKIK